MPTITPLRTDLDDNTTRVGVLAPALNALGGLYNSIYDYTAGKQASFATYSGQVVQILHGSDVAVVTAVGNTAKISRIESMSSALVPNPADFEANSALLVTSIGIAATRVQVTAGSFEAYSVSSGLVGEADACGVVSVGISNNANGYGIGVYADGRAYYANVGKAIGAEVRIWNNTGLASTYAPTTASRVLGLWLSSQGSNVGAAMQIGTVDSSKYVVGIGSTTGSILTNFIRSDDSSVTMFFDNGSHTNSLDIRSATLSGFALGIPNAIWIVGRNAANSADINMIRVDSSNLVAFGANLAAHTLGGTVTGNSQVISGVGAFSAASGAFGTTPAAAGTLRLPSATYITVRNNANSGDVNMIRVDASDLVAFGANLAALTLGGTVTGNSQTVSGVGAFSAASGAFGTTPAAAGTLRLPNATYITARNAANSGDINMIQVNASNLIAFGANLAALTLGGAITGNSQNITGLGTVGGTIADMSTGFRIGGAAASGVFLRGDGTNFIAGAIQGSDLSTAYPAATSFTPTLTSSAGGTPGTATSTGWWIQIGKYLFVQYDLTITVAAPGSGYLIATLPNSLTAKRTQYGISGREIAGSGKGIEGNASGTTVTFYLADNLGTTVNSYHLIASGWIEVT